MNELLPINDKNSSALTMGSREITKLVNSRHSDVCKSIETLISKGVIGGYQPKPYTHPQNGQIYYEYFLNKRDTYILVAQFSPEFTAAVIDRWQELENQQNPTALLKNRVADFYTSNSRKRISYVQNSLCGGVVIGSIRTQFKPRLRWVYLRHVITN